MRFSVSYPVKGTSVQMEIKDEQKWAVFYDKKMGEEVDGELLGEDFKGYVFKITGGQDLQGFAMI
jgi:small subunit ribosomal protein S6e